MKNEARSPASVVAAQVRGENTLLWSARILGDKYLRPRGLKCTFSIMKYFFGRQYMQAIFRRRPVARADHPLDEKIPFTPEKIEIYLDFIAYWIRAIGFLLRRFGKKAAAASAGEFLDSIGAVYKMAAEVYGVEFSTTRRPRYYANPRFVTIHAFDPHLMCVPSIHIMVIIRTYTFFRELTRRLGGESLYAEAAGEVWRHGLAIADAVLYVKQHSVNCVSAAMYAMTCFDPALFPPAEAERFASRLFEDSVSVTGETRAEIRNHILSLYKTFLAEGESAPEWKAPLVNFLARLPKVSDDCRR